jgi:DNA-binding transcriptional MerR regulator
MAPPSGSDAAPGGRGTKSASAYRTISEVAAELDVPPHVLRFWERKFPQVQPLKRGGGRRYYRPEDVDTLRHIRSLLYEEHYTIKGAQKLLRVGRRKARPITAGEDEARAEAPPPPAARSNGRDCTQPAEAAAPQSPVDQLRGELRTVLADLVALRDFLRARS